MTDTNPRRTTKDLVQTIRSAANRIASMANNFNAVGQAGTAVLLDRPAFDIRQAISAIERLLNEAEPPPAAHAYPDPQEVGLAHYYLSRKLVDTTCELHGSVHAAYADGEVAFVYILWFYAEVLEKSFICLRETYRLPGAFCYEVSVNLAPRLFIELVGGEPDYPDIDEWRAQVNKLVVMRCNGGLDAREPLLPQLNQLH